MSNHKPDSNYPIFLKHSYRIVAGCHASMYLYRYFKPHFPFQIALSDGLRQSTALLGGHGPEFIVPG
jgi:hypothetical protein